MTYELLLYLFLLSLVAAVSFRAGFACAQSYINAAQAVSEQAKGMVNQALRLDDHLAQSERSVAELRESVESTGKRLHAKQGDIEIVLQLLLRGLEQSGFARPERVRSVGRQVGEPAGEAEVGRDTPST